MLLSRARASARAQPPPSPLLVPSEWMAALSEWVSQALPDEGGSQQAGGLQARWSEWLLASLPTGAPCDTVFELNSLRA